MMKAWKSDKSADKPDISQRLFNILNKMNESKAVKIKCENLAQQALGSCGDRVGLAFVRMELALNLSDKEVEDMNFREVCDYAEQESVIKFLENKSQNKIAQIESSGSDPDDVEVYLAFLQIGPELGLKVKVDDMLYRGSSRVTRSDLEDAKLEFIGLDPIYRASSWLYDDEMFRENPLVKGIITKVTERDEFSEVENKDENSSQYNERAKNMQNSFRSAAIMQIALEMSSLKEASVSDGGVCTPNSTTAPTEGSSPKQLSGAKREREN